MKNQYFFPTLLQILPFLCIQFPRINATLTDQSCHQTALPNLCKSCVPEPPKDPIGVIRIVISCGGTQAYNMEKYVTNLVPGTDDAPYIRLTDAFKKCSAMWTQVGDNINRVGANVYRKNFTGARVDVSGAESLVLGCLDLFRQYPTHELPKPLVTGMIRFQGLAKVIDQLVAALH